MSYGATKTLGNIRYGTTTIGSIPIAYFDFHHSKSYRDNPDFTNAIEACYAYKDGDANRVAQFGPILSTIASDVFSGQGVTDVVPVLGSKQLKTSPQSSGPQAAVLIANALGAKANFELFTQTKPRDTLHSESRTRDERTTLVQSTLVCGPASGKRVLLVDDLLTTGATLMQYASALRAQKGAAIGAVVFMKYENDEALLNPSLY